MSEHVELHKAFVGRQTALDKLVAAFNAMLKGNGQCLLVAGEAGIGKTTLIEQFYQKSIRDWNEKAEQLEDKPIVRFAKARCNDLTTAGDPYAPFAEILDSLLTQGKQSFNKTLERFGPKLLEAVPWVGPVLAETAKFLFEKQKRVQSMSSGEVTPESLIYQYIELISELAEVSPLVIFVDDLHWADASSINLLQALSRRVTEHQILVIGAYRPLDLEATQDTPVHPLKQSLYEMRRYKSVSILELDYLPNQELIEYLQISYPGLDKNNSFTSWLFDYSEGWPMCMVEVMLWLESAGYILRKNGTFLTQTKLGLETVPDSLQAVIQKRLSTLEDELALILKYASVQGEEFNSRILAETLQMKHLQLLNKLRKLSQIYRVIEENQLANLQSYHTNWTFNHSLFHRVVYEELSSAERIELHQEIVSNCEKLYSPDIERITGMLANQCEKGELYAKGALYRLKAAYSAREVKSYNECLLHTEKGLNDIQNIGDSGQLNSGVEIDLLWLHANSRYQTMQHIDLAIDYSYRALELANNSGDLARIRINLNFLYILLRDSGKGSKALDFVWEQGIAFWEKLKKEKEDLILAWAGGSNLVLDNPKLNKEHIIDDLLNAKTFVERKDSQVLEIMINYAIGSAYLQLYHLKNSHSYYKETRVWFERTLNQISELDVEIWNKTRLHWRFFPRLSRIESRSLKSLAKLHESQGEWELAISYYQQVAEQSKNSNDLQREAGYLNLVAVTWLRAGKLDAALESITEARYVAEKSDTSITIAIVISTAIDIAVERYDIQQSQKLIEEFSKLTSGTDILWANQKVLRSQGLLCMLKKDLVNAQHWLQKAIVASRIEGARLRYGLDLAIVEAALGKPEKAKERAHELINYYGEKPNRDAAEAHLLLSRIATKQGSAEDTKHHDQTANDILQSLHILHRKSDFYRWIDHNLE